MLSTMIFGEDIVNNDEVSNRTTNDETKRRSNQRIVKITECPVGKINSEIFFPKTNRIRQ